MWISLKKFFYRKAVVVLKSSLEPLKLKFALGWLYVALQLPFLLIFLMPPPQCIINSGPKRIWMMRSFFTNNTQSVLGVEGLLAHNEKITSDLAWGRSGGPNENRNACGSISVYIRNSLCRTLWTPSHYDRRLFAQI